MIDQASLPIDAVRARYDALARLVASIPGRPPGRSEEATSAASSFVHAEARMLDLGAYDGWLERLADDAIVWIPLDRASHPGTDQALFLDDRRRLTERVRWRRGSSAWGQQPNAVCVRTVGTLEAWPESDDEVIVAHSAITISEQRAGHRQTVAGHQIHELVDGGRTLRTKILLLPALALGIRNPSFLL